MLYILTSAQFCSGFALISDGYQNNLMTMTNVILSQVFVTNAFHYQMLGPPQERISS
jgi:hypothetical protein